MNHRCPSKKDRSPSLECRTPFSTLPVHPLPNPSQFPPAPQQTPFDNFPAQYPVSAHLPVFQNQPNSQPLAYRPLESAPYPSIGHLPLPPHQPQAYLHRQSNVLGGNPSYQQAQLLPPLLPQLTTSSPGPPHGGVFSGIQQYVSHPYSAIDHMGSPQSYLPGMYQWYYSPGPSADTFIEGGPMQVQQRFPMNYPHPQTQLPRRGSNTLMARSRTSEPSSLPATMPSSSSAVVSASRSTISPTAGDPPKHISVQSSPKADTHQLRQKPVPSNPSTHERPVIRRHYHPGPPPRRSEWVMWIGNVSKDATRDELWRFLKQPVTVSSGSRGNSGVEDSGVISIFLISRSNCAFANYESEEHLNQAISQFSGRTLRPHDRQCPRLVCRARRMEDDLRAGVGVQRGIGVHTRYIKNTLRKGVEALIADEEPASSKGHRSDPSKTRNSPLSPSASRDEEIAKTSTVKKTNIKALTQSSSAGSHASTSSSLLARYFPKRFFILKSLTREDLDLSTERGVWATQRHNEAILDQAFRTSKEVILVFSVNKSGEFYGYARSRMASGIFSGNHSVSWAPRAGPSLDTTPRSTSRVSTHNLAEQFEGPPSKSQMHASPSEHKPMSPSPFVPSLDKSKVTSSLACFPQVKSTRERRSALPALDPDAEDAASPHPPPRSDSGSSRQGWPLVPDLPSGSSHSSTLRLQLERHHGLRAARSEEGGPPDDSGNHLLHLPPLVKEAHTVDLPVQTDVVPAAITGHGEGRERGAGWGETFKIEWLCTDRVRFYRTRYLRNPWNHSREIKVSRDGTELEPRVGQQLVDSWSTLAIEPAGDNDAMHTSNSAGRRGGKSSKPGSSVRSKRVKRGFS